MVSVQNSQTGEVQRIAAEPNQNNLRLLGMHLNPNPQLVEAVIEQGREQGTVRFRFDLPAAAPGTNLPESPNNGGEALNRAGTNAIPPANQSIAQPAPYKESANRWNPGMARVRTEGATPAQQGIHSKSKFRVDPPPKGSAAPPQ